MAQQGKGRRYDNASRQLQSQDTRLRILDAARDLILDKGYRATTVSAIADHADVHVDTVYRLVGRKPIVLRELIERAISGTDGPVPADRRDYVAAMKAEPDPRTKLELYARATREIHGRLAPLLLALGDASATEPEAREVWQEISDRRARNMRRLARDLSDAGGLRPGLTVAEAADVIWATNSAELYVMLTDQRGWPPRRYERWLVETWSRLFLPDDHLPLQ
ncbi:MAG: TetR/AcrR family transcriptional regulator [Acidimicrobiales bacterium]